MIAYFRNIDIIRKILLIISLYFSSITFLILLLNSELLPSISSTELFWIPSSTEIRALLAFLSLIYFLLIIYFEEKLDNYDLILTFTYYVSGLTAIASQNLIVILLALEFLSLSATFLIAKSGQLGPALIYGILSFLSGAMFMAAISNISFAFIEIASVAQMEYFNKILLFLSIIMHCGLWPISIAVVNGYSAASPPHAAFLQLFSTKACLIVLYKLFLSQGLLLYFSAATIIYSLFYSFRENNLRRLITYNTIGQVGLISLAIFLKGNIIPHVIVSALYQTLLFIIISQLCSSIEQQSSQPLFTHLKGSIMRSPLALLALIIITSSMMALPLTASFITKALMLENSHINYKSYYYYFFIIGNFLLVLAVPLRLLYSLFLQNSPAFEKFQLKMKSFKGVFVPSSLADTYISEITIEDLMEANKGPEQTKRKTDYNIPQALTSLTPLAPPRSDLVLLPSGAQEIQFSQTRRQKLIIVLFSIILVLPPFYLQEFPLFYTFPSIIWGVIYFLIYLLIVVACAFTASKKFLLALLTIILALLYYYSYFPNPYVSYSFYHIIEPLIYELITIGFAFYFRKKLYNSSFASAAKYNYNYYYSYYSQDIIFFCVNFLPYLFSLFQKLLAYSHSLCRTYIKALISYYGKASTAISATSETQGNIVELTGLLALSLLGIFLLLRLIF